ncbi:hypothetical protein RvY_09351 [Ramazzottius varieornatus]|uniref:Uncharacterized protein n=1 Tax=Ramazzottius varieornatus TaxID=947166 RepID=A0A1D1V903_RAMVA|nr:hypothetical protein RvY_09351 [Ramazzottius varieornatus]
MALGHETFLTIGVRIALHRSTLQRALPPKKFRALCQVIELSPVGALSVSLGRAGSSERLYAEIKRSRTAAVDVDLT